MELLQELHHQARSALRDKDINSERQEVDAVHEDVAEEQGEAKAASRGPVITARLNKLILIEIFI